MNKQNEKMIAGVILALAFAAVCWTGYEIADTVLFNTVHGNMTIFVLGQPERTVTLTSCKLVIDSGNNTQLVVSDGVNNGMIIYLDGQPSIGLQPIEQNQKLLFPKGGCKVLNSSLELVSFSPRSRATKIQSWKGSITARCTAPNTDISFTTNVHACL